MQFLFLKQEGYSKVSPLLALAGTVSRRQDIHRAQAALEVRADKTCQSLCPPVHTQGSLPFLPVFVLQVTQRLVLIFMFIQQVFTERLILARHGSG